MNVNYVQIVDSRGNLTQQQKKCMESVKRLVDVDDGDTYEVLTVPYSEDHAKMIFTIDTLKMHKAAEDNNLCIVDTDCFLTSSIIPSELEKGKPYFGEYSFDKAEGIPDIFLFYVNGCKDYFAKYLSPKFLSPDRYSFDKKIFQNLKDYMLFPDMMYMHYYTSMREVILNNQVIKLTENRENVELELMNLRRFVEQMALSMKVFDKLKQK